MSTTLSTDHAPLTWLRIYWRTRGPKRRLPKYLQSWHFEAIDELGTIMSGPVPVEIREGCVTLDEAVVALAERFGVCICSEVVRCGFHEASWAEGNVEFCDDVPDFERSV